MRQKYNVEALNYTEGGRRVRKTGVRGGKGSETAKKYVMYFNSPKFKIL